MSKTKRYMEDRKNYLLEKDSVCPLDKEERLELEKLLELTGEGGENEK